MSPSCGWTRRPGLRDTDEKTYLIAEKTGYADPNYFSYVFKRHSGVTPLQVPGRDSGPEGGKEALWGTCFSALSAALRAGTEDEHPGVIALSFTTVAVVGMVFMGLSLVLRFSNATAALVEDNTQRVLHQVNMNLDSYLRRMMRISDTMYYRVIKSTDLADGTLTDGMSLLYEENRDALVSIAVFDGSGALVSAAPLAQP